MGKWRDESSWAQSDTDRTPKTWTLAIRGTRLVVTRHMDYPGKWCVEAHGEIRITIRPTDCITPEAAQAVALDRLRWVCESTIEEIRGVPRG